MRLFQKFAIFAVIAGLAACSGGGMLPAGPPAQPQSQHAQKPQIRPQDSPESLPGDSPESLPGDSPESLPGGQLACSTVFRADQAHCTAAIDITLPKISALLTPAALLPGLHPDDLRSAYNVPSTGGDGTTVAIVDAFDDPTAQLDLNVYRSKFGLPPCLSLNGCFKKVNERGVAGAFPAVDLGWSQEVALDLDVVSAICPHCKILLVEADSASVDDLGTSVDTAVRLGAKYVSNSYYSVEWPEELSEDAHYNHPGVAITASAGDQRSAFYPAASPYVTAVGGTSLAGGAETPWPYGGGGCSAYEAKPAWQSAGGCTTRTAVDVAAVADPHSGVTMFDSTAGGWMVAGGTSVGSALVAAAYAVSNNPQPPSFSYAHAGAFNDVLPAGFDAETGLGSPHGVSGL